MGGDCGVAKVEVLVGSKILPAKPGPDEGQFGFRRWSLTLPAPPARSAHAAPM